MWHQTRHLVLSLSLLCLFSVEAAVTAQDNSKSGLFPVPQVLKPNVEFWKKVYAQYSERQVIIHDAEDLSIVYEVVHLDSLFRGVQVSERLQWKKIERIKRDYAQRLLKLSRMKELSLERLRGKDRRIAALFGSQLNKTRLRRAAKNVRAQSGLKERFKTGLVRSGLYLEKMRQIFRDAGVPEELLVLPHVESSFDYTAYSRLGAAGMWQFTRSTGRLFLKINYLIDERLDPIKATQAAVKLLKKNYEALGSWPLAITAYNHGLNGMKSAARKYGNDLGAIVQNYRSRSFGFASRNFYAEFLAALQITKNYKRYFGEIEFARPLNYVTFSFPRRVRVRTLIKKLNLKYEEFASLNPALRTPVLKSRRTIPKNYTVRIPHRPGLELDALYALASPGPNFKKTVTPGTHRVRNGETLSAIANAYNVPLEDLLDYNDIENAHLIYAGQILKIPSRTARAKTSKAARKIQREIQLAEAPIKDQSEINTALDTSPISLAHSPANLASKADVEKRSRASVPKLSGVTTIKAKPRRSFKLRPLLPISIVLDKKHVATVEQEMAMALPDFHVEFTRTFDTRIVRSPYAERIREFYRDIPMPENGQIVVEPEETLGHLADWLEVSTQKLRDINGLSYWEPIHVGQSIWLTFEKVTPEEFHRRRLEYHQGIEEDFYNSFYVEGVQPYKVKRGENIWIICNKKFEIPYWLVKKYNPDQDLSALVAGQEILIPIVNARDLTSERLP